MFIIQLALFHVTLFNCSYIVEMFSRERNDLLPIDDYEDDERAQSKNREYEDKPAQNSPREYFFIFYGMNR
ncbi:hypothetical protein KDI_36910 [Dictyobacter arantiisoli]|uniref:Uncharacterized protein n=1 Tax=Dictyobacter arantiisoli TaxID=2014874 RepID=A0A5A5TFK1_9CHLR|nr:hypothetical protein KDI_36910 [Dictyobacter arantiisoli]